MTGVGIGLMPVSGVTKLKAAAILGDRLALDERRAAGRVLEACLDGAAFGQRARDLGDDAGGRLGDAVVEQDAAAADHDIARVIGACRKGEERRGQRRSWS
jgi:hypothetical protein